MTEQQEPWDPGPVYFEPPARASRIPAPPPVGRSERVTVSIDDGDVTVPAGTTLLQAIAAAGQETPTLCTLESLTPVNVCRLCVVEVAGSRALVPSCSRRAEPGMVVLTDSERVRHSRRLVLELLGSSVDMSIAGTLAPDGSVAGWMERYGADPGRFGPAAPAAEAGEREARAPGHHHAPDVDAPIETVAQPVKVDNELYVRDYARCILCYKCVEACGIDAQNTFAIAVAGRGFDARIATEFDVGLPQSACVYCGNCIGVCPTGALMGTREHAMRDAGTWDPASQSMTTTVCPFCGVGCAVELHVQDGEVVKVTSPLDSSVTEGHLCIKGRFGYESIQPRAAG
jgi:predicted molibdopterin-dependent oxidoreductase YjgC